MLKNDGHIRDHELLQSLDGELSARRVRSVQTHLEGCWKCRARVAAMEETIHGLVRAHALGDGALPSADGPRALLRAQMSQLAQAQPAATGRWLPGFVSPLRVAALSVTAVTAIVAGTLVARHAHALKQGAGVASLDEGALPERKFTPGATRVVAMTEVCSMPHEDVIRAVSEPLREQVLHEYGIKNAHAGDFEIDYLITPGLGGADDIHNLWPEPYAAQKWNAHVKDALEQRLHQMVCSGDLDLPTAQREIATDWIAAYKKYFHTEIPLAPDLTEHAALLPFNSRS